MADRQPTNMTQLLDTIYEAQTMDLNRTTVIRTSKSGVSMRNIPSTIRPGLIFAQDAIIHQQDQAQRDPNNRRTTVFDYMLAESDPESRFAGLTTAHANARNRRRR